MQQFVLVLQIVLSVLLTACVLLQSQGTGLGSGWGGGGEHYHTKRGVEKALLYATILLIALFTILAVINGLVL